MYLELKTEILDIIEIVQQCPEKLQEKCFEMLLSQYISEHKVEKNHNVGKESDVKNVTIEDESVESTTGEISTNNSLSDEIKVTDFHIKIQRFFSSNGI